jgi:hypothetical protein
LIYLFLFPNVFLKLRFFKAGIAGSFLGIISITIFEQWMDFYPFDYTMFFSLAGIADPFQTTC